MEIEKTVGALTEKNVQTIAEMEKAFQETRSTGSRVADSVAAIIGSWPFIIAQSVLLFLWVAFNVMHGIPHWDVYPFVLLNLALSFQAAYSSPIIMMSQNRQELVNQRRNHLDLQINLLSEQENTEMLRMLRLLCQKLDVEVSPLSGLEQAMSPENVAAQIDTAHGEERK